MKAEHIQEALNLLPDDLIEKVDTLRARQSMPKKRIWKTLSAVAACLAVLILGTFAWRLLPGSGFSADSTAEANMAADMEYSAELSETAALTQPETIPAVDEGAVFSGEPVAYTVSAQYVRTELLSSGEHPGFVLIQSLQELEDYCNRFDAYYDLSAFPKYTDAYFEKHDLLILLLQESKPDFTHEITTLAQTRTGVWALQGCRYLPERSTKDYDPTYWHILVDVQRDLLDPDASFILTLTDMGK